MKASARVRGVNAGRVNPAGVRWRTWWAAALVALVVAAWAGTAAAADVADFASAVAELKDASYSRKAELVRGLAELRHPGTRELLAALLEGNVYARASDGRVFIVAPSSSGYSLTDPLTGTPAAAGKGAGTAPEEGFEKVGINNSLRRVLRSALAQFDLSSPDKDVRLGAVKEMLRSFDEGASSPGAVAARKLLQEQLAHERDAAVEREIDTGLALAALGDDTPAKRFAAIATLRSSLNPDVYNRLVALTDPATEPDIGVRNAAARAVRHIDSWRKFYGVVEMLFFGLSLGDRKSVV